MPPVAPAHGLREASYVHEPARRHSLATRIEDDFEQRERIETAILADGTDSFERVEQSRRQLERGLLPSGVLLKLEPEDGGYVRVSDARLEPPANKKRGRSPVIKKFIWAALLSIFMALGSVLARRVADGVWRATVREEPPTTKSKVDDD